MLHYNTIHECVCAWFSCTCVSVLQHQENKSDAWKLGNFITFRKTSSPMSAGVRLPPLCVCVVRMDVYVCETMNVYVCLITNTDVE